MVSTCDKLRRRGLFFGLKVLTRLNIIEYHCVLQTETWLFCIFRALYINYKVCATSQMVLGLAHICSNVTSGYWIVLKVIVICAMLRYLIFNFIMCTVRLLWSNDDCCGWILGIQVECLAKLCIVINSSFGYGFRLKCINNKSFHSIQAYVGWLQKKYFFNFFFLSNFRRFKRSVWMGSLFLKALGWVSLGQVRQNA